MEIELTIKGRIDDIQDILKVIATKRKNRRTITPVISLINNDSLKDARKYLEDLRHRNRMERGPYKKRTERIVMDIQVYRRRIAVKPSKISWKNFVKHLLSRSGGRR